MEPYNTRPFVFAYFVYYVLAVLGLPCGLSVVAASRGSRLGECGLLWRRLLLLQSTMVLR